MGETRVPGKYRHYHLRKQDAVDDIKRLFDDYNDASISEMEFRNHILEWAKIGLILDKESIKKPPYKLNTTIRQKIGPKKTAVMEHIINAYPL